MIPVPYAGGLRTDARDTEPAHGMIRHPRFLMTLAVLAAGIVYFPIIHNYFVYDDFLDLYVMSNASIWTYVLHVHGGHVCVARNVVFYLCHWLFGTEPAYYFGLVLLTHLLNVALLFSVI